MQNVKFLLVLFLVALLVVVGSLNMGAAELKLGFISYSLPLFFLLLGAMVIGAVTTWIFLTFGQFRLKRRIRSLHRKVRELEAQLPAPPSVPVSPASPGADDDSAARESLERPSPPQSPIRSA